MPPKMIPGPAQQPQQQQIVVNIGPHLTTPLPHARELTLDEALRHIKAQSGSERQAAYRKLMAQCSLHLDKSLDLFWQLGKEIEKDSEVMRIWGGLNQFHEHHPWLRSAYDSRSKRHTELVSAQNQVRTSYNTPEIRFLSEALLPFSPEVWMQHQPMTRLAYIARRNMKMSDIAPFINTKMIRRLRAKANVTAQDRTIHGSDWDFPYELAHALQQSWDSDALLKKRPKSVVNIYDPAYAYNWFEEMTSEATSGMNKQRWPRPFVLQEAQGPSDDLRKFQLQIHKRTGLLIPATHDLEQEITRSAVGGAGKMPAEYPYTQEHINRAINAVSPTSSPRLQQAQLMRQSQDVQTQSPGSHRRRASSNVTMANALQEMSKPDPVRGAREYTVNASLNAPTFRPINPQAPLPRVTRSMARKNHEHVLAAESNGLAIAQALEEEGDDFDQEMVDNLDIEDIGVVKKGAKCGCSRPNSPLNRALKNAGLRRRAMHKDELHILTLYYDEISNGHKVCFQHGKATASYVGVAVRALSEERLQQLLKLLYTNRDRWGDFKNDPQTYILFQRGARGYRDEDQLKSYRFFPAQRKWYMNFDRVIQQFGMQRQIATFHKTGTVIMGSILTWIHEDPELKKVLDESYSMYDYHLRRIQGKSNLGWGRIMYHSPIQQLIRSDPAYWVWYAVLRKQPCLISYPYYAKSTSPGDNTAFKHVDCNLEEVYHNGRGADMIQGSVSWDEEDEKNCTILFDGFHTCLDQYMAWRKSLGRTTHAYIEGWVDARDWPPELNNRIKHLQWIRYPCKPGWIRISKPTIPHGSTGPATKQRRTMLPWFVRVCDDMKHMEVPEMGAYDEIAAAHRNCTAPPATPSGHPNKYGGIDWPFPGAAPIQWTSAISRALVCQERWDSPQVHHELATYFGDDMTRDKTRGWIQEHRKNAKKAVLVSWEVCKEAERIAYGPNPAEGIPDRSYFSTQGAGPPSGQDDNVADANVTVDQAVDRFLRLCGQDPSERRQAKFHQDRIPDVPEEENSDDDRMEM